MIFLDTSGVYALADRDDRYHGAAVDLLNLALERQEEITTHDYVIVESAALLQRRLGLDVAVKFLRSTRGFTIIWVDADLHDSAVDCLATQDLSRISLVDALSFRIMTDHGIGKYIGFDQHFSDAGFVPYE